MILNKRGQFRRLIKKIFKKEKRKKLQINLEKRENFKISCLKTEQLQFLVIKIEVYYFFDRK